MRSLPGHSGPSGVGKILDHRPQPDGNDHITVFPALTALQRKPRPAIPRCLPGQPQNPRAAEILTLALPLRRRANAGRQARKAQNLGPACRTSVISEGRRSCSRCQHCPGRTEPVKAVCDRRATASVNLPGERTREDGLDRTCPKVPEMAAIGSRDTCGQNVMTFKRQQHRRREG